MMSLLSYVSLLLAAIRPSDRSGGHIRQPERLVPRVSPFTLMVMPPRN
jgi:hypothetical protein